MLYPGGENWQNSNNLHVNVHCLVVNKCFTYITYLLGLFTDRTDSSIPYTLIQNLNTSHISPSNSPMMTCKHRLMSMRRTMEHLRNSNICHCDLNSQTCNSFEEFFKILCNLSGNNSGLLVLRLLLPSFHLDLRDPSGARTLLLLVIL
jgi:hypothetical protein